MKLQDGTTLNMDTITLTPHTPDTYRRAWATIAGLPDALGIPEQYR